MFTSRVKIQFHHCDPAGILFYANIYTLAHDIYQEFLAEISQRNYFFDKEMVLPITKSSAEYYKPMRSGDSYQVDITVSQLKNSSFELKYIFCDHEKTIFAEVKTVHVVVNKNQFQKTDMPADLQTQLKNHSS